MVLHWESDPALRLLSYSGIVSFKKFNVVYSRGWQTLEELLGTADEDVKVKPFEFHLQKVIHKLFP